MSSRAKVMMKHTVTVVVSHLLLCSLIACQDKDQGQSSGPTGNNRTGVHGLPCAPPPPVPPVPPLLPPGPQGGTPPQGSGIGGGGTSSNGSCADPVLGLQSSFLAASPEQTLEVRFSAELDHVSSLGTRYSQEVLSSGMPRLPRGSALLTSSGQLSNRGITAIIHAASGSVNLTTPSFIPTVEGVSLAVKNSIILAQRFNHTGIAIPFVGGDIFRARIGVSEQVLAEAIIRAALDAPRIQRIVVVFVFINQNHRDIFNSILGRLLALPEYASLDPDDFGTMQTSILNFERHHCSAIVNAANMEGQMLDGIAGTIADASGQRGPINTEARNLIIRFNARATEFLNSL